VKPRLIILSDLWGKQQSDWINHYVQRLEHQYDIQFYDCCELGDIDITNYTQEALHRQFVEGGIDRAVERLTQLETTELSILAFSIGGTIAWKYALKNSNVKALYCLSSTRLRYEMEKPKAFIKLWYGEQDAFKPSKAWSQSIKVDFEILQAKSHEMYHEKKTVESISREIIEHILV
jgi:dienelactone hydrolase